MRREKKRKKYLEALKTNKLLKDLKEEDLVNFLNKLEEEIWPKTSCNVNKSRTSHYFHFIISGRLKVYQVERETGREFTFFILRKGDAFDVLCLLDGCEHDVYYETIDRVVLLSIPIVAMRDWIAKHPEINKNLLPYLSHQMRILEEYASNVTLIDISTRLARLILKNINRESHQLELINDLSNEEIANLIGSTRAVVNRHLQQFKHDGILSIGREKVAIKDLDLLLEKARSQFPPSF
ncbi:Crp/Fnr family transcriptional regulator [Salinimicrobium oceani]|uniref:Crp/Fnr family transcriptional regulator n=1 Tax=Salinimicrobium oceani TaxID=2722702 RepID=A0ABX1D3E6_9FLAO|nr:Crp/Fnr family transcriptional regulator [Salinimicrobium oceani]NJW53213.1 Crp/Fnr family transcriptional regulator [Salinimicrobium oceani]